MALKINQPPANPFEPEGISTIYHYTNMNALLNIVRPGHIVLWATHYQYLNDKDEIKKGVEIMKNHFEVKEEMFKNMFILALSRSVDNITMWLNYSDGYNGCILGFKYNELKGVKIPCSYGRNKAIMNYEARYNFIKSLGEPDRIVFSKLKLDANIIDPIGYFMKILHYEAIIGYKDESFEYENEIRIINLIRDQDLNDTKYRNKNGVIIPYLEQQLPKEVLSEIWIPKNEKTEMNKQSLQLMLNQYGYNNVEIKVSKTPYRNI